MNSRIEHLKIAVSRRTLLLLAALAWIGAGSMLVTLAHGWLEDGVSHLALRIGVGLVAALAIHHFGFSRIVDKNLARIAVMRDDARCAFSFFSWKSYLTIVVMVALGALLRHSPLPKPHLAVVYLGIGGALVLSSLLYLRGVLFPPAR